VIPVCRDREPSRARHKLRWGSGWRPTGTGLVAAGSRRNAKGVSASWTRDPQESPTRLIRDGSPPGENCLIYSLGLVIPEEQFSVIHVNDHDAVPTTLDKESRRRFLLAVVHRLIDLDPVRSVAGLEQSAHRGWTNN